MQPVKTRTGGLTHVKNAVDTVLAWVVIILMAAMALDVLWQVFTRFVLRSPSSYTEELARYMLIWLGLLGASYVMGKRMHLAIDVLTMKLEGRARLYSELFIQVCIWLFAVVVMVIGGVRLVYITLSLEQISAALQVPLGYVYLALPLSGLLMAFYATLFIVDVVRGLMGMPVLLEHDPKSTPVD
jgi:TRAP-type C4-dicarboxylate transport system permease small subunit